MPQRVPTREEVQMVTSSLLVTRQEASTSGVPIATLDNDYREQEGMRIPFRELGHSCLLDCLKSMSLCLTVRQRNGTSVVYPLTSEKTAHVSSLVARQKATRKKSSRGGRRLMGPSYPKVYQPPRRLDRKILSDVRMAKNRRNGIHRDEALQYIRDRLNHDFEAEDLKLQLREINNEIVIERDIIYPVSNNTETARNSYNGSFSWNTRLNTSAASKMPQRVPTREEVQMVISALLVTRKEASTSGVPIATLDNDYREQEGMRIPFRELASGRLRM